MCAQTPAELKTLFESDAFARETTCTGPLGPEYALAGTRLRLWAPTAQSVCVNLYRKGSGGVCMGTLPLERGAQGVWSIYLPGDQHGLSPWTALPARQATPTPGLRASTAPAA